MRLTALHLPSQHIEQVIKEYQQRFEASSEDTDELPIEHWIDRVMDLMYHASEQQPQMVDTNSHHHTITIDSTHSYDHDHTRQQPHSLPLPSAVNDAPPAASSSSASSVQPVCGICWDTIVEPCEMPTCKVRRRKRRRVKRGMEAMYHPNVFAHSSFSFVFHIPHSSSFLCCCCSQKASLLLFLLEWLLE